jgi:hypothetical protein
MDVMVPPMSVAVRWTFRGCRPVWPQTYTVGAQYNPVPVEVPVSPSVISSQEKTESGSVAPRKPRKAGERSR